MNYDQAIRSLQDTAVVMAEIQRRQSHVRKIQAGLVESLLESDILSTISHPCS